MGPRLTVSNGDVDQIMLAGGFAYLYNLNRYGAVQVVQRNIQNALLQQSNAVLHMIQIAAQCNICWYQYSSATQRSICLHGV